MNKFKQLKLAGKIKIFFATGFLTGYFPVASGTIASFVALLLFLFIPHFSAPKILIPVTILFTFLGIYASDFAEKIYGFDPPEVVIDEFVGMWLTMFFIPPSFFLSAIGFILFRVFDIVKPFPVRQSQSLKGGWGIMIDDLIAGFYSLVILHLLMLIFPEVKNL